MDPVHQSAGIINCGVKDALFDDNLHLPVVEGDEFSSSLRNAKCLNWSFTVCEFIQERVSFGLTN